MNLNRTAIRKTLKDYKEAKRQQAAILKDQEIQKHFELEEEEKARNLIAALKGYDKLDWASIKRPLGPMRSTPNEWRRKLKRR